jgi:hypothetical protein
VRWLAGVVARGGRRGRGRLCFPGPAMASGRHGGERLAGGPDGDDVGDVPTRGGGHDSTICRQGVNDRWAQGARRPRR